MAESSPKDFPVVWEHPDDARLFWTRDRVHYADQMSRLTFSILSQHLLPGWRFAAATFDMPVIGPRAQLINSYLYTTMVPFVAPPEEMAARAKRNQEKLMATAARVGDIWRDEWLPEIKECIGFFDGTDLSGATMPALSAHFEEMLKGFERLYEIHFLLFFSSGAAMALFEQLYGELFGKSGTLEVFGLVQGFENKSLETDRALWELSMKAKASPEVIRALNAGVAAEALAALELTAPGRAFSLELQKFLTTYGWRSDKLGFDAACWVEDPTPVIINLAEYVNQPSRDWAGEQTARATERERLVSAARERLKGYPRPVVQQFDALLKGAQDYTVLVEDHAYWIDHSSTYYVRRVLLEFGRRLRDADVITHREDVSHLTLDELRETVRKSPSLRRQDMVSRRREEWELFKHATPPLALGTPTAGPPPPSVSGMVSSKFFGAPAGQSSTPDELRGTPASPGKAQGPAKIVHTLSETGKLQPGDILVAETTMPPWTSLFAIVAAVVTDAGGVLSHGAVVAREYGIPAVVATDRATGMIKDGQIIEVDGDAGVVRILSP